MAFCYNDLIESMAANIFEFEKLELFDEFFEVSDDFLVVYKLCFIFRPFTGFVRRIAKTYAGVINFSYVRYEEAHVL